MEQAAAPVPQQSNAEQFVALANRHARALALLREVLHYRELGSQGPLKSEIRQFLAEAA